MTPSPLVSDPTPDTDKPSCHACRRRKLKCSREQPSCANCQRQNSPCVYDAKKNKPGVKTGAVEGLSKRVEALERAFHDQSLQDNVLNNSVSTNIGHLTGALGTLASEIQRITSRFDTLDPLASQSFTPSSTRTDGHDSLEHADPEPTSTRKRKRTATQQQYSPAAPNGSSPEKRTRPALPSSLVDEAIQLYFARIFYWIPMIHTARFEDDLQHAPGRKSLSVILDAMLVATLRFVDRDKYHLSAGDVQRLIEEKRDSVILSAMSSMSVQSLQALIILTFTTIGNGDSTKAWPLIASMTRTVEYLQLTVEDDDRKRQFFKPLKSLPPPRDWIEEEERRRVFWNIFNLDRYCSMTTGWNLSLTSHDIHRRLPAYGSYWYAGTPVVLPYFETWSRSPSRPGSDGTGNTNPEKAQVQNGTSNAPGASPSTSSLGGFSYAVQATEYLNHVATCFLHQDIDFNDQQEVTDWLTRFKELDLHLVHWKMFLPKKWRDPNRAPDTSSGPHDLDHSMTLAHVTHNTSMILLHHRIAYPPPEWSRFVPLPSACSAATCRLAASKTSSITETWLRVCPEKIVVPPQVAFCTFLSARVLLVHSRYHGEDLLPEFWVLVRNLEHMARRWAGLSHYDRRLCSNLAGKYAVRLRELRGRFRDDPSLTIRVLDYSESTPPQDEEDTSEHAELRPDTHELVNNDRLQARRLASASGASNRNVSSFVEQGPSLLPLQHDDTWSGQTQNRTWAPSPAFVTSEVAPKQAQPKVYDSGHLGAMQEIPEDLLAISQTLMGEGFAEMDRIITLDDSFFETAALAADMSMLPPTWDPNGMANGHR
ncbi:fungal-specific transcription factor domain-containing protein [Dactylonectria estremocensis]|uniref:Fungal-specific transcription factor domain-containing protein n=1 Tax=Dactylonectria estremocensis TaxID=1079267 RepID=A0A9P9DZP4_9HYPO|nr:fungal-specific transcription factor domain-containing protein [Dactylonectria estremocensis]